MRIQPIDDFICARCYTDEEREMALSKYASDRDDILALEKELAAVPPSKRGVPTAIKRWRKCHKLSRRDAAALLGLSLDGYGNQAYGKRRTSRQSKLLMLAWDFMNDEMKDWFLGFARDWADIEVRDPDSALAEYPRWLCRDPSKHFDKGYR